MNYILKHEVSNYFIQIKFYISKTFNKNIIKIIEEYYLQNYKKKKI